MSRLPLTYRREHHMDAQSVCQLQGNLRQERVQCVMERHRRPRDESDGVQQFVGMELVIAFTGKWFRARK